MKYRSWLLIYISLFIAQACSAVAQSVAVQWENAALAAIRNSPLPAPAVARALAIVDTCMYDAWAAYDERATGTQLGDVLRRPAAERTLGNKNEAVSYAAYRALVDVLPESESQVYKPLLLKLGYSAENNSRDITAPGGIGNVACSAVLAYRHGDKANQLGTLAPGAYSDWTAYRPMNKATALPVLGQPSAVNHWQPLIYTNSRGERISQLYREAHWGQVMPFALKNGDQFRAALAPFGPAQAGTAEYENQLQETVAVSAGLTDRQKMIAEFWQDDAFTVQPAGHWINIATSVSERDRQNLDGDVKLYFLLSNALMDAGIAAWDAKTFYDSVRPVTAISAAFRGKTIQAWGGPGKGTVAIDGSLWIPYQHADAPTPAFPEFVSGHSAYSAAAASILALWTGSDYYMASVVLPTGSSKIEPGVTPKEPVRLEWKTFSDAAAEAGMSRRYGGIHFKGADLGGRELGRLVGAEVWARGQLFFLGTAAPKLLDLEPGD